MGGGTNLSRALRAGDALGEGEGDSSGAGEGVGVTDGDSSAVGEGVGVGGSCALTAQSEANAITIAKLIFLVMSSDGETSLIIYWKWEGEEQLEIPRLRSE